MNITVEEPTLVMNSNYKWVIQMPDGSNYKKSFSPNYDLQFDNFEQANYFLCNMQSKKKHKVRLNFEMDIEVSTDYLEKLCDQLSMEIVRNCFKNHNRTINSESMTIIKEQV